MTRLFKSSEETFDVVLSGGSPWGFTLQGGSEFRTKLSVSKVTPGGKADISQSIAVGDEVIAINGIDCISRSEAIELVRCSRQKLKIKLRREGGSGSGITKQSNVNGTATKKSSDIIPNLYKTAAEHFSNSDFYSTYNVDRQKFAQITQNSKRKNIYDSTDNLSASLDDLLESYRQSEKQPKNSNSAIMEGTNGRLSNSSTVIANGRASPGPEVDGLRRINSLNNMTGKRFHNSSGLLGAAQHTQPGKEIYGRTWSLRRGVSLPEGSWPSVSHQRTYTSPGRIQKVTVKSTNISSSPQKGSPPGRDNQNQRTQQMPRSSVNKDDWVGRWLLEEPTRVTPINAANIPYKAKNKNKEKEIPDRRISMHERTNNKKSQSLPRSKSFGGPESYGVTVTATAVKRNEGSSTLPPSKSPQRYNSSNLIQEKPVRASNADDVASRPVEMSWNSQVYAAPGDTVEVRLPRDVMGPKMTTSESTSSLDSVGTMDSSVSGSRRQGPAPPPRRSVSKLLSSFRTQGRREVPEQVQIPPKFGAVSRVSEVAANQPIHSASRSWPTEHVVESKASGTDVRQSWHAEPAISRREANSSTASDGPPERKLSKTSSMRYKSTVVITNMRSSSSSSVDENSGPTLYRSGQTSPEADKTQSDALQLKKNVSEADSAPVRAFGDAGGWMSRKPDSEAEKSRIEDTQILQRLLKDKANNVDRSLSVKSRVANFEGGLSRRISAGVPHRELQRVPQRSSSQGKIEVIPKPLKSTPVNQSSSMDSLLETHSPTRFNEPSTQKRYSALDSSAKTFDSSAQKQDFVPENRPSTKYSAMSTDSRESLEDSRPRLPPPNDKTPPKHWETNDNFFRSKSNEQFRPPSRTTPSVATDSAGTRELMVENLSSTTRVEKQHVPAEPVRKIRVYVPAEQKVNPDMERFPSRNEKSSVSNPDSDFERKPVEPELPPPSTNDDSNVFWDPDDSLPPPPPLNLLDPLETSQDSLPLPSPPREVLVEFPDPYSDFSSRNSSQREHSIVGSDIVPREEVDGVPSPFERGQKSKVELNGSGKFDTSDISEQALETTTSTDLSFADTSPAENKTSTHRAPPPAPLVITSTPTRDDLEEADNPLDSSPYSLGSSTSTPSGSRPNSMLSPKLEALDKEKSVLIDSMKQKIVDLRSQMDEIKDEINGNEELGEKVTKVVEKKASPAEFSKYQLFTGELNKIIGLLLILTQRMHRYEMMLNDLDMSEEADRQQKDILLSKIDKVTLQHEEACKIKEVNDKRGEVVSKILENCLEEEEFADFQYYIDMKTQLALMHAEIRDKVKMGEERLNTLTSTKIDWSIFSLT